MDWIRLPVDPFEDLGMKSIRVGMSDMKEGKNKSGLGELEGIRCSSKSAAHQVHQRVTMPLMVTH
jgi:hypothetical protein